MKKSVKINISVKIYIQNKMVSIGYPAHVGDFVTSLKEKRKNRLQYVPFYFK